MVVIVIVMWAKASCDNNSLLLCQLNLLGRTGSSDIYLTISARDISVAEAVITELDKPNMLRSKISFLHLNLRSYIIKSE